MLELLLEILKVLVKLNSQEKSKAFRDEVEVKVTRTIKKQ
jgi:hypothetical protein